MRYGSSYYPFYFPRDQRRKDLDLMKSLGLNTIRTAEWCGSWYRIEPREGEYEFGWLDEIFDLADKRKIKIVLGVGTEEQPIWLNDKYPDVSLVNQRGERPPAFGWHLACYDHPGYRREAERYTRKLVSRYKDHPALFGYQVHNEIGYPWLLAPGLAGIDIFCYCKYTLDEFREWLKRKYRDLETLNERITEYSFGNYTSWDQVEPPRYIPLFGGPRWIDWREFLDDNIAEFLSFLVRTVKDVDPEHPVGHNLPIGASPVDPWWVLSALNIFKVSKVLDAVGLDLYPANVPKARMPEWLSMWLDIGRSAAEAERKDLWVPELSAWRQGGGILGSPSGDEAVDIGSYTADCIGHGAKMMLYQSWREPDISPYRWGSLVSRDGERLRPFAPLVKEFAEMLDKNQRTFLESRYSDAELAIFHSRRNQICHQSKTFDAEEWMDPTPHLERAIRGVYKALHQSHIPIDFIDEGGLLKGNLSAYKALIMPFSATMSDDEGSRIREFVEHGRTILSFAQCASLDGRGRWHWTVPGAGLDRVFGYRDVEPEVGEDFPIEIAAPFSPSSNGGKCLPGYKQRQLVELYPGVKVVGRFVDGAPAVIMNEVGSGKAVSVLTHLDAAYATTMDSGIREFFSRFADWAGVQRRVWIDGMKTDKHLVELHLLQSGDSEIIVTRNHADKEMKPELNLGVSPKNSYVVRDILRGEAVEGTVGKDALRFEVNLPPRGYAFHSVSKK